MSDAHMHAYNGETPEDFNRTYPWGCPCLRDCFDTAVIGTREKPQRQKVLPVMKQEATNLVTVIRASDLCIKNKTLIRKKQ